jgi:hypothetical protein
MNTDVNGERFGSNFCRSSWRSNLRITENRRGGEREHEPHRISTGSRLRLLTNRFPLGAARIF